MLKILKVTKNDTNCVFELEIDNKEFNELVKKTKNKIYANYSEPGFRKGHVPKSKFDAKFTDDTFRYETLEKEKEKIFTKLYESKEFNDSKAIDFPINIEVKEIGDSQKPVLINITLEALPKVIGFNQSNIKNLELKKFDNKPVDEKIIDAEIKRLLKKEAMVEDKKDKVVANGDIAVIDFKGFIDDKPFNGGEAKNYELEIGSKSFIDNFEEQLIGLKKDDKKDIFVTFPANYQAKEMAGKKAKFEVKVNDVKSIEYPKVTKDFLEKNKFPKDVTDETSLKNYLRKLYSQEAEFKYEQECTTAINDFILKNAKISYISKGLSNIYKNQLISQYEQQAKQYGFKSLNDYLKLIKSNIKQFEEQLNLNANNLMTVSLVFNELIDQYKIKAELPDIEEFVDKIAKYQSVDKLEAKKIFDKSKAYFESQIINQKLVKKIISEAKKK